MGDVGKILKDARTDKGLTLDDLQQTTKIQKRYLIAIEEENFAALPGNFYVKAFIKQYAETVGLDPEPLMDLVSEKLGENKPVEQQQPTTRTQLRETRDEGTSNKMHNLMSYLPTAIVVIIVIGIVGTIYFVTYGNSKKAQDPQLDSSQKVSVSSEVSKKASSKKASSSQASSKAKEKKKTKTSDEQTITSTASSGTTFTYALKTSETENKISFEVAGSAAWNALYADNVQQWQGTLNSGETKEVTLPANTKSITIDLGNSKATTLKINGKEFNFLNENSTLTVRKLVINVENSSQE